MADIMAFIELCGPCGPHVLGVGPFLLPLDLVYWEEVSAKGSTRWTYKASRLPTELVEDTHYNPNPPEA
jgi:hypothetical protein